MKRRVIAIVQARLESTRLPNKVLLDINGKPMIWHVLNRLSRSKEIDGIVVAIPKGNPTLHQYLHKYKFIHQRLIRHVLGSPENVLSRYYKAATISNADVIVRITADCPMIDPKIVDLVVRYFNSHNYSYVCNSSDNKLVYNKVSLSRSNVNLHTLDGFDVEVFSFFSLCNANMSAIEKFDLEHVTPYIVRNNSVDIFEYPKRFIEFHLSVNTEEDLFIIRNIFDKLGNIFSMEDAIKTYCDLKGIIHEVQ